ncbi:MAG: class I SAM-dependent methyltransferase [Phycisphaerales bacterium JB065]
MIESTATPPTAETTMPSFPEPEIKPGKLSGKKGSRRNRTGKFLAEMADRHVCYEASVQCVEAEIDFVTETFEQIRKRPLRLIREDFCGTANTSCEFVSRHAENRAIGVDLDEATLQWGRDHKLSALDEDAQSRVDLRRENVLSVETEPVDAILAMNFSYFIFQQRDLLRSYFERCRAALKDDGVLFLDCFGGHESYAETEDEREIEAEDGPTKIGIDAYSKDGFTYVWDQHKYNPITGEMVCKIHFHFPDKSKIKNAFTYVWRMWTLPELREILSEAGFSQVDVYWEGTDEESGEGNGEYSPTLEGEADPAWVSYIVAQK